MYNSEAIEVEKTCTTFGPIYRKQNALFCWS